jgi:hypothetical protein
MFLCCDEATLLTRVLYHVLRSVRRQLFALMCNTDSVLHSMHALL